MKDTLFPEDTKYTCTLDAATIKKAQDEINEDPKEREGQVQALREWIKQQPHLHCRLDTPYLLMFLRGAKFSQLKARHMLEGNLEMMAKLPEWWRHIDTADDRTQKLLRAGYIYPLPKRDRNGCRVFIVRTAASKLEWSMTVHEEIRAMIVACQYTFRADEYLQVNGYVMIFDCTGATLKGASKWTFDVIRKWFNCWQGNLPGRYKAFHYYNINPILDSLMELSKTALNKKLKERFMLHGTNLESVYKHVPQDLFPDEYLADDYDGPSAGPEQKIIDDFADTVKKEPFRTSFLKETDGRYYVDLSKKPSDEPQASFRNLNID